MEYQLIIKKVEAGFWGLNFEAAAEKFAIEVNQQIARGWEPQGGTGMAGPQMRPYLFQAMIKRH
jgi:hypothetical protein